MSQMNAASEAAVNYSTPEERRYRRLSIGMKIAAVASLLNLPWICVNVFGLGVPDSVSSIFNAMMAAGVITGIVSYFFGGIKEALRPAWRLALLGYMVPVPWLDLILFTCTFVIAGEAFVLVPVIPMFMAYRKYC